MIRWATFDCYGTLIDWNAGIRATLARVFGESQATELLHQYHELEPMIELDGSLSYREVMTEAMRRLGAPAGEEKSLADSLPSWPAFPEVQEELRKAQWRGWKLAILSNTDRDFIEASKKQIGIEFDETIVAGEIHSYKPAFGHWQEFSKRTQCDPALHVHVAASLFHDIRPAMQLGVPNVWINRLHEVPADVTPTRTLLSLDGLADVLDELVPLEPIG